MPDEFEQLQPHEFLKLWDAYQWRQEQEENRLAYFTACQMSVHTKKPVAPKVLLEPLRKKDKKQDKEESKKHLMKTFKKLGGGE